MAREIAEMIRHAHAFAERFEAPETVSFRAEWSGLPGRKLGDPPNPFVLMQSGTARDDRRVFTRTVPVASLADGWPEFTATVHEGSFAHVARCEGDRLPSDAGGDGGVFAGQGDEGAVVFGGE